MIRLSWRIAALKNGFLDALAYRLEFFIEIMGSAFVPAVTQWTLWYALFEAGGLQTLHGMSYQDMLQYTFVSLLFSQVRGGDQDFEIQEMIRSGQLSNNLLRPVGILEFVYLRSIAPRLFIATLCLLLGLSLSLCSEIFLSLGFSKPALGIELHPLRLLGAMGLALMGNLIHYQIGAALAASAFYWEESFSVLMVKNMLVSLLSGELIPLYLFPANLSFIWKLTPFYLYVYGPSQFALGKWSVGEFLGHCGIGVIWIFIAWGMIRLSWSAGMKRYLSLGG